MRLTRMLPRYLVQGLTFLTIVSLLLVGCGNTPNSGTGSTKLTVQVLDGGGELQMLKPILQNYQKAHPDKVVFQFLPSATAPSVPGKIKAQEDAHKQTIALVLGGYDMVASGIQQNIWEQVLPKFSSHLPDFNSIYQGPVKQYATLTQGYAIPVVYTPSGPLFEYDPSKIANPPTTIDELKAWIIAHPGKFEYAQPRNSGPGRTLLMGLPYLLGDSDPTDPTSGWAKTWQFLKDINSSINYYPTRTGVTMNEVGNDTRWMIASTMGWDINPRFLGQVPAGYKTFILKNTTFVADDQFIFMPRGLDDAHQKLILDIINYVLQPAQQAYSYDSGYFYPGPAILGVTPSMAPAASQEVIQKYGRPEYDGISQNYKIVMPLSAANLSTAFNAWDSQVGGSKLKSS
ncbi:MAG TPA: extracellular solute-binding protein [Ktedonobacteraceae bacterium]